MPLSWELCHTSLSMTASQGTPLEHLALVVKRLALLALRDCNNPCSSCQATPPGHCTKNRLKHIPSLSVKEAYLLVLELKLKGRHLVWPTSTRRPRPVGIGLALSHCLASACQHPLEVSLYVNLVPWTSWLMFREVPSLPSSGGQQGLHASVPRDCNKWGQSF